MLFNFSKTAKAGYEEIKALIASYSRLALPDSKMAVQLMGTNLDGGATKRLRIYLSRKEAKALRDTLNSFELDATGPGC